MKNKIGPIALLTVTGLFGLLTAFLILICYICGVPILYAILASIVVLIVQFLISPWLTDLNMRWVYKAQFDPQIPEFLEGFITDVCAANDMAFPRIGYIDDGAPNAFTYGRTKNDSRIILTRGIFELLDEEEVKAVVGHELGHAVHYDMMLMTAAQLVPMVLYAIYQVCSEARSSSHTKESKRGEGGIKMIGFIAYILYVLSNYVILWLSRAREYYADRFSAETTGNPNALASALVEIGFGLSTKTLKKQKKQSAGSPTTIGISDAASSTPMAVCCYSDGEFDPQNIRNAMKWDMWNVWAKLYELKSTHPLISKRLLALSEMSLSYDQEPYITFDEKQPESYVDDFAKELLIYYFPIITVIAALIIAVTSANPILMGLIGVFGFGASLLKFRYSHPGGGFTSASVRELLGIVKVSGITSVPCELRGKIIGRGNPGCVFNEDFVVQDETGIIMLDYQQPLFLINKIFALFKSPEYFDKIVTVRGWYRRSPVPYIEIKELEINGETKKCHSVTFGYIWRLILFAICLAFAVILMFAH